MTLFAEHVPRPSGTEPPANLVIREGSLSDLSQLTHIAAEREGGGTDRHRAAFERLLVEVVPAGDGLLLAATIGAEAIGFAKVARFRHATGRSLEFAASPPTAERDPPLAPEGWYLAGVVVKPEWRRRGVGDRLTAERLAWIARRASGAYYFVNARNTVSIDLHHRFGFVEITRRFAFPGASFEGGEGILFAADLAPGAGGAAS